MHLEMWAGIFCGVKSNNKQITVNMQLSKATKTGV